jgi:hypothetical protein
VSLVGGGMIAERGLVEATSFATRPFFSGGRLAKLVISFIPALVLPLPLVIFMDVYQPFPCASRRA